MCSVQFSSVAQSCPTLCYLMDCSTPGLPVYHQLLEFTQTHVLPGASVRKPARDKVMRKEADIRKACSDFRDPSGNS